MARVPSPDTMAHALTTARSRRCCTGDDALARQLAERASLQGVTLDVQQLRASLEDGCEDGDTFSAGNVDDPWDAVDAALDAGRE